MAMFSAYLDESGKGNERNRFLAVGCLVSSALQWGPIRWTTEIRQWDAPYCFVDVQRSGPYKLWHHTHRFEAHNGRTKMIDVVRYALPFGVLGRMVHALKVRGDVRRIFDYRRNRIHKLFSEQRSAAT